MEGIRESSPLFRAAWQGGAADGWGDIPNPRAHREISERGALGYFLSLSGLIQSCLILQKDCRRAETAWRMNENTKVRVFFGIETMKNDGSVL